MAKPNVDTKEKDSSINIPPTPDAAKLAATAPAVPDAAAAAGLPAMSEYEADAGAGMEGIGREDQLVPFVRILDTKSPQVDADSGLPGARPGMIFNTATQQYFDGREQGVKFIPVYREHTFVEWVPVDAGGGFVGVWDPKEPHAAKTIAYLRRPKAEGGQGKFGKLKLENGNELAETFTLYGIMLTPEGEAQRVAIAFASTQIKKYQTIISRLVGLCGNPPKYPIYAFRWRLTTQAETKKTFKWFGWRVALDGATADDARLPAKDPLFLEARNFYGMLKSGTVAADYTTATSDPGDGPQGSDDDIPM